MKGKRMREDKKGGKEIESRKEIEILKGKGTRKRKGMEKKKGLCRIGRRKKELGLGWGGGGGSRSSSKKRWGGGGGRGDKKRETESDQWLQYVLGEKRTTDLPRTGYDKGMIGQSQT
jgi:hypothetical protein